MSVPRPSTAVLSAFDATGRPALLAGGRGGTWRAGDIVLKRSDHPVESGWIADALTWHAVPAELAGRWAPVPAARPGTGLRRRRLRRSPADELRVLRCRP